MSTAQTWQTESTGLEATLELAAQIGHRLRGGETIVLMGDLGAGKTAFTKGLVQGAGSTDVVRSPSFTLSNQYRAKDLTLHHFDFYRLDEPGIMAHELQEVMMDPQTVTIVEWAAIIKDVLPAAYLTVQISTTGETGRLFKCIYPESLQYLIPTNT